MLFLFGDHAPRLGQFLLDIPQQADPDILPFFKKLDRERYAKDAAEQ
ncbi:hypothetical protein SDC9_209047 [bioreactor metagenome]|uniref:Uncharacterized protein n=1 Tax=bioreactor metagenome TaxID=1076179 RepID=A0A645JDQ0_9ZZZZ